MQPSEMIARRRSVRRYVKQEIGEELRTSILSYLDSLTPLYPGIGVSFEFLKKKQTSSLLPMLWLPPDILTVYTEEGERALVNVGFLLSQLDLHLQGIGLGACWLGLSHPKDRSADGSRGALSFCTMMAVGVPADQALRTGPEDFSRRPLSEIADPPDACFEPARLAPSAMNGQPWRFVRRDGLCHMYCVKRRSAGMTRMNRLDVGIALGHLYVSSPDAFSVIEAAEAPELDGYTHILSFVI